MRKKAPRSTRRETAPEPQSLGHAAGASGVVIVVELGAAWPGLVTHEAGPRRVVAQLEGESPAQFAARAVSLVDGLFGRGVSLGTAILSCNERLDGAAEEARRKLAGLLLGCMAKQKTGKLHLCAAERSGARLRHELTCLSRGLHEEWRTAGLEATVCFGDARAAAEKAQAFTFTARVA